MSLNALVLLRQTLRIFNQVDVWTSWTLKVLCHVAWTASQWLAHIFNTCPPAELYKSLKANLTFWVNGQWETNVSLENRGIQSLEQWKVTAYQSDSHLSLFPKISQQIKYLHFCQLYHSSSSSDELIISVTGSFQNDYKIWKSVHNNCGYTADWQVIADKADWYG